MDIEHEIFKYNGSIIFREGIAFKICCEIRKGRGKGNKEILRVFLYSPDQSPDKFSNRHINIIEKSILNYKVDLMNSLNYLENFLKK